MADVSATEAARNFADILDAVEHRGERFTIVRRGRAVAQIEPVSRGGGRSAKSLLLEHAPDPEWRRDLDDLRSLLVFEDRG